MRIFINGTFDILHMGHLAMLNFAKSLGGSVNVAIDSDARVKRLKGSSRPINNQMERMSLLMNIKAVDDVCIFDTDEELVELIKNHDIMIKGSDYKDKPIIGSDFIEIQFFDRINEYSTTNKIQDIISGG